MKYRTFQPQFHAPIRAGTKISTIRGKPWAQVGERVALRYWTGSAYRSPMGILGTAVVDLVAPFEIDILDGVEVVVDGKSLDQEGFDALATQEGFPSSGEMGRWFYTTHKMPFRGTLTRWDPRTLEMPP